MEAAAVADIARDGKLSDSAASPRAQFLPAYAFRHQYNLPPVDKTRTDEHSIYLLPGRFDAFCRDDELEPGLGSLPGYLTYCIRTVSKMLRHS